MHPDRWKRIERLYHGVLASSVTQRAAALDELCSVDEDVRREVESLLSAREQANNFLSPAELCDQVTELISESFRAGHVLGCYHILSPLGAGAMGEVYLARDARLDRQVALKILPVRFTRDRMRVARFQREAKAASALNHPNIVTIYEIGEVYDTWFIAAEFVQGTTLRERINAGSIALEEVLEIAHQCARALAAAHQAGIVHRDVKPENIMVRTDGLVKVVDFGLARMAETEKDCPADVTQAGALIGTPRYMSPEQARGQKVDARTDIFSLGAVLYEMVARKAAFPGATTAEVFAALLGSPLRPPSECVDHIPQSLDAIVLKALEKDPEARYQKAEEFAADLQRLQQRLRTEPEELFNRNQLRGRMAVLLGSRQTRRGILATGTGTAAAFALLWYERAVHNNKGRAQQPLSVVPLTTFGGVKDFASFSPDGGSIVFSWNGDSSNQKRNVYTKKIGPDDPVRRTSASLNDMMPAWSPDGQSIAFCRELASELAWGQYAIYVLSTGAGQERKISEGGMGVSWSPDSQKLAIAGLPAESGGISLLSLQTGERHQLTEPRSCFDSLPVFSPDGRWIAFTRDFGYAAREIFVIATHGGTAKQLTFDREPTYGAAWTGDSREIVFASNRGGGGESLWRVNIRGGGPTRVSPTLEGGFYPSISRTGNLLAYTESSKNTNIYAYEGPGFGHKPAPGRFNGAKSLIASSRRDDSPNISPDGKQIAFVSKRTGNEEIWIYERNGGRLTQLTSFKGAGTGTPRWSPDGQWIAFDSLAAGNPDIYVISAKGGTARRLTTGPSGNFMPSWSPDGQWIYFKSQRSGSDQIWRIPTTGGAPVQITQHGGSEPFASPDGKLVYYNVFSTKDQEHSGAIWTVPVEGGPEKPLTELERFNKIFRSWGVIEQGIYFIAREDAPRQIIRFFNFATRQVTPLATMDREPIWNYPNVALSNDGRCLLFACLDQEVNDLMMIENFR